MILITLSFLELIILYYTYFTWIKDWFVYFLRMINNVIALNKGVHINGHIVINVWIKIVAI